MSPFIAQDLAEVDLTVSNVTTIEPRRTFWDKVVILHGLRRWFERRGVLRQEGARISRHYYDVHQLLNSATGGEAVDDVVLARDCTRHARMFFNRPDLDLATAIRGSFALTPVSGMIDALHQDYISMSEMIFGPVPDFRVVIESAQILESRLNEVRAQ